MKTPHQVIKFGVLTEEGLALLILTPYKVLDVQVEAS